MTANVSWRTLAVMLGILALVIGLCALNLRCAGDPGPGSTVVRVRDELQEARRARRIQEADNLSVMARDLRVLARRYLDEGDKKKAQRAIGAAQELDKRIQALHDAQ